MQESDGMGKGGYVGAVIQGNAILINFSHLLNRPPCKLLEIGVCIPSLIQHHHRRIVGAVHVDTIRRHNLDCDCHLLVLREVPSCIDM